jgi:hypothetical protein
MSRPASKHPLDLFSLHTRSQVVRITGNCSCHEAYKSRGLLAPDCVYHDIGGEIADLIEEIESLREELREMRNRTEDR